VSDPRDPSRDSRSGRAPSSHDLAAREHGASTVTPPPPKNTTRPPSSRVLLVDEDIEELATLAAELRQRGIQVSLANGTSMACERAKAGRFDVLVASAALAEMRPDGLSLLDALAVELGRVPPFVLIVQDADAAWGEEQVVRGNIDALVARIHSIAPARASIPDSGAPPALYAGSLAKVSLADVIETLSVDRKTGTLAVTTLSGAGDLRLADGQIVDAVYLRFEGMKALVRSMGETDGRFLFSPETPPVMRRMHARTSDLLREGKRQLEEAGHLRALLGELTKKALLATEGGDTTELSTLAKTVLARLRAPATIDEVLDDSPEADASLLAAIVELDSAGRLRRLAHETHRVPLAGTDQLHLMRALVSRASAPGFAGAARLVFAGTPSRLAVFAHAALCLADSIAASESMPAVPVPYPIATVRMGDDVDLELVALPLVPAYAPLWPMALAGSAIVVRLDDAAGAALTEACAIAELPILDAQMLVGALEEASVAQVAGLVRAALEATQGQ
jgi:CheY-like chemotaxis protein